jgi:hypothetical protein
MYGYITQKIDNNNDFLKEKRQFFRRELAKIAEIRDDNIGPGWGVDVAQPQR